MKDGSQILFTYHKLISKLESIRGNSLDWSDINVCIFVSTGRTGTHFMSHLFNDKFEKTFAVHEPDINIYDLNINYLKGKVKDDHCRKMIDFFRKDVRKTINKSNAVNYIESNLELSFLIPVLKDYFKNFKVIHVVRNPKDVVRSYYSREAYGKWVGWVPFMSDKDPRDRLNAGIFPEDPYSSQWQNIDRFEKICWYWNKYNELIERNIENDVSYIRVSFEDLFKRKDVSEWNRMIEFMELQPYKEKNLDVVEYMLEQKSNDVKKFKIGKYQDWSDDQKKILEEICGERMKNYGYQI